MAICKNKVEVTVPRGWDYKVVEYPCSSTGPQGEMILCPQCEPQRKNRQADADHDNAWLRSAGWGEI
jgi:hypothetical protein